VPALIIGSLFGRIKTIINDWSFYQREQNKVTLSRDSELYHCLYANEEGVIEDLLEVQLIENIPLDRIPVLRKALQSNDAYIVYQSTLVLSAWGDSKGLRKLEDMVDHPPDTVLDPDNITDQDRTLDKLALALSFSRYNGNSIENIFRVFKKLLEVYPNRFFKGDFSDVLEELADRSLLNEIINAFEKTYASNIFQSSDLLPVIAKLDPAKGWQLALRLMKHDGEQPNPVANVAKSLFHIKTTDSQSLLEELCDHTDRYVTYSIETMREKINLRAKHEKIR